MICYWQPISGAEAKRHAVENVCYGADAGGQWACKESAIMALDQQDLILKAARHAASREQRWNVVPGAGAVV